MMMEEKDIADVFKSIKSVYNFNFQLKDKQMTTITALINKRNVFALLPTGYGKSMCYVLPPLLLDEMDWTVKHIAVIVCPLKSLMKDQVETLKEFGVRAIAVEPDLALTDISDIKNGRYSVIFISPELATSRQWRRVFLSEELQSKISLLAFDEAHCISEWGEDFRPVYKDVMLLRSLIDAPVLAATATCNEKMRKDIFRSTALDDDTLLVTIVPDRPNIYLEIRRSKQDFEKDLSWLANYIRMEKDKAMKIIVYCRSVGSTATLYNHLKNELILNDISDEYVNMFHRSISDESAERILDGFRRPDGKIRCLFATVAFGMGMQIPDVSVVVHWGVPKSVLCYWQEIGRAGRDGRQSYAICYAYGRSLVKTITDDTMITLVKSVNDDTKCLRGAVLNALRIEGMAELTLDRRTCDSASCQQECLCALCSCCSDVTETHLPSGIDYK